MFFKLVIIAAFALFSTADAQIAGKYSFATQQNFDQFIGSVVGVEGEKYTALLNAKPQFQVTEDGGDKFTISRITPTKTVTFTFKSGETVTADPLGAEQPQQFTNTLENGALVSKSSDITITRTFTPTEMVLTFNKGSIVATRHFTRTG